MKTLFALSLVAFGFTGTAMADSAGQVACRMGYSASPGCYYSPAPILPPQDNHKVSKRCWQTPRGHVRCGR